MYPKAQICTLMQRVQLAFGTTKHKTSLYLQHYQAEKEEEAEPRAVEEERVVEEVADALSGDMLNCIIDQYTDTFTAPPPPYVPTTEVLWDGIYIYQGFIESITHTHIHRLIRFLASKKFCSFINLIFKTLISCISILQTHQTCLKAVTSRLE